MTEGGLTLVADARIYNRDDLARALDCPVEAIPDAALILRAYIRWGAACLQRINGDFGIAIHDAERGSFSSPATTSARARRSGPGAATRCCSRPACTG